MFITSLLFYQLPGNQPMPQEVPAANQKTIQQIISILLFTF